MLQTRGYFALAASLLISHSILQSNAALIANQKGEIKRWPTTTIPVLFPTTYTAAEDAILRGSAQQISSDLGHCINFTSHIPGVNESFIVIQPAFSNPNATQMCYTFPGYNARAAGIGQAMVMFGSASGNSTGGCLDNPRDAMRIWANALGLLNEWKRKDRYNFIKFPAKNDPLKNLDPQYSRFHMFTESQMVDPVTLIGDSLNRTFSTPFDLNSVTMVNGWRFAAAGKKRVFDVLNGRRVGRNARLSEDDCAALKFLYECPAVGTGPTPRCTDLAVPEPPRITLHPTPSILSRNVQCSMQSHVVPIDRPPTLAYFWLTGVEPQPNTTNPTLTTISSQPIPVAAKLISVPKTNTSDPSQFELEDNCTLSDSNFTNCQFAIKLVLTSLPNVSFLNSELTLVLDGPDFDGEIHLPVNISFNCAPRFTSITASEGPSPHLTHLRTLSLWNNDILLVERSKDAGNFLSSQTVYRFNQSLPFGQSITNLSVHNKVFINCNVNDSLEPVVLGEVTAIDPDGEPVSFQAYEENDSLNGYRFHVTNDGVMMLIPQTRQKNNESQESAFLNIRTARWNIIATDPHGAISVLETSFILTCL